MPNELERRLSELRPGDHLCPLHDDETEQTIVAVTLLKHGLMRGERCVYAAEESMFLPLLNALAEAGVDVERERGRGALQLLTESETYLHSGSFAPQTMIDFLGGLERAALKDGFTGLRYLGVMTWALKHNIDGDRLIEYEAAMNRFLLNSRSVICCQYCRPRFDAAVIHDVLRTHPVAILGKLFCPNPYYEPPELLLRPEPASIAEYKRKRADWWIARLKSALASEQEHKRTAEVLFESEERIRLLLDSTAEGIVGIDREGNFIFGNKASARILGHADLSPFAGRNMHELVHHTLPDGTPYLRGECRINRAIQNDETIHADNEVFWRADGTAIPVEYFSRPMRHAGKIVGAVVTFFDISERKRAQEERERLLQQIQESHERLEMASRQLISIQETERRNLARELHDEIGQLLTLVNVNLQLIKKHLPGPGADTLIQDTSAVVNRVIQQVRDRSLNLRPSMLDDFGLAAALRWYAERMNQGVNLKINSDIKLANARFAPEIETAGFRIVQEAITNTVRHAKATEISILAEQRGDALEIEVRDNGVGFDLAEARQRAALGASAGILGMIERAALTHGRLDIESRPGCTVVRVRFTLSAPRKDGRK